jgi:hypothetical protein
MTDGALGHLLSEIGNKESSRDDVAATYARYVRHADIDWLRVNKEIVERWSTSALTYIKTKAWELAEKASEEEWELDAAQRDRNAAEDAQVAAEGLKTPTRKGDD